MNCEQGSGDLGIKNIPMNAHSCFRREENHLLEIFGNPYDLLWEILNLVRLSKNPLWKMENGKMRMWLDPRFSLIFFNDQNDISIGILLTDNFCVVVCLWYKCQTVKKETVRFPDCIYWILKAAILRKGPHPFPILPKGLYCFCYAPGLFVWFCMVTWNPPIHDTSICRNNYLSY